MPQTKIRLIKRGAEADIFLVRWFGEMAISKIRKRKPYRNVSLDSEIRKKRTVHEANMLSAAKLANVTTPFIYFVDPKHAEIVMERVEGENAKDIVDSELMQKLEGMRPACILEILFTETLQLQTLFLIRRIANSP